MRTFIPVVFTLSALAATAAASAADPASAQPTAKHGEWRHQVFEQIDTNRDGTISRAEYQIWVDGRFAKLDANADDSVDANEVATSQAAAERVQKRAEGFVRRYDASGDGQVTKADFEAKEMRRFDKLSDGADSITEEQFAAARANKHHRKAPSSDSGG